MTKEYPDIIPPGTERCASCEAVLPYCRCIKTYGDDTPLMSQKHPRAWGIHLTGIEKIDAFLDRLSLWWKKSPSLNEDNLEKNYLSLPPL